MCGDLDDEANINAEIHNRLAIIARRAGIGAAKHSATPIDLAETAGRSTYMERLFAEGLAQALADVDAAAEEEKIDAIACQAIALARLAGFLAGQLPPDADLFRAVIEAITEGHAEPRQIADRIRSEQQDHHHDHHHGHNHHHDHPHGH